MLFYSEDGCLTEFILAKFILAIDKSSESMHVVYNYPKRKRYATPSAVKAKDRF